MASPRNEKASTSSVSVAEGTNTRKPFCASSGVASTIILPMLVAGDWMPIPSRLSVASPTIALTTASDVRQDMVDEDAPLGETDRTGGHHKIALAQAQRLAADIARQQWPTHQAERPGHQHQPGGAAVVLRHPWAKDRRDQDGQQQARKCEDHIGQARDQRIDPAA